jgi:hypothetical protein
LIPKSFTFCRIGRKCTFLSSKVDSLKFDILEPYITCLIKMGSYSYGSDKAKDYLNFKKLINSLADDEFNSSYMKIN